MRNLSKSKIIAFRQSPKRLCTEISSERMEQIEKQLHEYCKLDTFAMVRMWEVIRDAWTGEILETTDIQSAELTASIEPTLHDKP